MSDLDRLRHNQPMKRFSDDELLELHVDVRQLKDRLQDHIESEDHQYRALVKMQQENATAIKDLTAATQDMVEAWQSAQGAVKFGAVVGRFTRWLSGLAIIGGLVTWALDLHK